MILLMDVKNALLPECVPSSPGFCDSVLSLPQSCGSLLFPLETPPLLSLSVAHRIHHLSPLLPTPSLGNILVSTASVPTCICSSWPTSPLHGSYCLGISHLCAS